VHAQERPSDIAEPRFFLARRYGANPTQERRKPRAWHVDRGTQIASVMAILLDLGLFALGVWYLAHLAIRLGHFL
jgi:hypothetical protein